MKKLESFLYYFYTREDVHKKIIKFERDFKKDGPVFKKIALEKKIEFEIDKKLNYEIAEYYGKEMLNFFEISSNLKFGFFSLIEDEVFDYQRYKSMVENIIKDRPNIFLDAIGVFDDKYSCKKVFYLFDKFIELVKNKDEKIKMLENIIDGLGGNSENKRRKI